MDETVRPLRIPPQMFVYADKHNVSQLVQSMLCSLVIDQPDDPICYLIGLLQRSSDDVPRVIVLGPPAVGKHTVAKKLSADLRAVHVTEDSLLQYRSELSVHAEQGWVLEGIPQTRLQALSLQAGGVIPEHVVMLEAPDDVLMERSCGRLVDAITGDVYHRTFILPDDDIITKRLEKGRSLTDQQRLAKLHRYRCEVTGLRSAYQHMLKVIDSDQPHADVYLQVLAFVRTRQRSRTPRILLLGPPGSGKSRQAQLLSEKYRMVDVSCGRLLRSVAAAGSTRGAEVQAYLDDGRPVPDSLLLQVLEDRLSRPDCTHGGWILHGFPCDLQQARSLQESHQQPNRVFFLELTDDVCLERLSLRATDPVSGQSFHHVTRPAPSSEVQHRLKTRPEDSMESVTQRLKQYRVHSAALQSVYPEAIHIDADQDPHSVFEAVASRLTSE
ncbi:adenylate kinase 8 isoform X2 [Oreochromis aureus]|uniref:adenylate kinase 8 isoform X2 n=1 Tax=Oreochromis aureus TaxID=47969 RepID=UPI0019536708|nr:adenylate kinase 8 isoform X2 [Oreochromis aureus]